MASMCAARHQYRPVVANKGRLTVPRTDSTNLGGHWVRLGHYYLFAINFKISCGVRDSHPI